MGKTSPTKIQAKDIPAGLLVDLIRNLTDVPKVHVRYGVLVSYEYASRPNLSDICKIWDTVPPKVIRAKLRMLIEKYHILEGCACGCSSVFSINENAPYEIRRTISKDGWVDRIVPSVILPRKLSEEEIADRVQYLLKQFNEESPGH